MLETTEQRVEPCRTPQVTSASLMSPFVPDPAAHPALHVFTQLWAGHVVQKDPRRLYQKLAEGQKDSISWLSWLSQVGFPVAEGNQV